MLAFLAVIFIIIFIRTDGRVLLYNTENGETVEKFDCVYYVPDFGEEVSYCRRPVGNHSLNQHRNECVNQGEKKLFRDLLTEEVHPRVILEWSSSIEMADFYAAIFYDRSLIDINGGQFVCKCAKTGTFGKYCEYRLTHEAKRFSEAVKAQFKQKKNGDSWDTQRYGKLICYKTLSCPSSPLCLDWREICDGIQRCSDGIDEENCDKLEFNECEDDEFRCTNGMCISEEFWLDGKHSADCSKKFSLHSAFPQVIMIVWIGAMNTTVMVGIHVHSTQMQLNAMSIYVSLKIIRVAMENVFCGTLEWHFNEN